jgi:hypothetical protein
MSRVRRLLLAAGLGAGACAPLTYADAGAVDFAALRSVRVHVTSPIDSVAATLYFADELREVSGFARVSVDSTVAVDAVLEVYVSTLPEAETRDDGSIDSYYSSQATYRLSTPADPRVDSGTTDDRSEYEWEAVEDALDQIAAHYIRPYRL